MTVKHFSEVVEIETKMYDLKRTGAHKEAADNFDES